MANSRNKVSSVLFFGRKDDKFSKLCHEHLLELDFNVKALWSNNRGEDFQIDTSSFYDFIFCFRSYYILSEQVLSQSRYAINFHPAPPKYPGSGGVNFALLNNDSFFGVTIHLMDKKVDSGRIIHHKKIKISTDDNVEYLLEKKNKTLFNEFKKFTQNIFTSGSEFIQESIDNSVEKWGNFKGRINQINDLQEINIDISDEDLEKKIRCIHTNKHPIFIRLHGRKFILKK